MVKNAEIVSTVTKLTRINKNVRFAINYTTIIILTDFIKKVNIIIKSDKWLDY
jgi:hypothetical protein